MTFAAMKQEASRIKTVTKVQHFFFINEKVENTTILSNILNYLNIK